MWKSRNADPRGGNLGRPIRAAGSWRGDFAKAGKPVRKKQTGTAFGRTVGPGARENGLEARGFGGGRLFVREIDGEKDERPARERSGEGRAGWKLRSEVGPGANQCCQTGRLSREAGGRDTFVGGDLRFALKAHEGRGLAGKNCAG